LGLLGGTFDPVHLGHLILADEALAQLNLDAALFILTPTPPHKVIAQITPVETRRRMMELALEGLEGLELSDVDILRPGPHYALDTVRLLRKSNPADELIYLIGEDSLATLPEWHRPEELIAVCDSIGVMRRSGTGREEVASALNNLDGLAGKLVWIDAPQIEISSTDIRARVAAGRPYRFLTPPAVYRYIRDHHLYTVITAS
jgi:nicotinate-nucleotide adenylyltransferase